MRQVDAFDEEANFIKGLLERNSLNIFLGFQLFPASLGLTVTQVPSC